MKKKTHTRLRTLAIDHIEIHNLSSHYNIFRLKCRLMISLLWWSSSSALTLSSSSAINMQAQSYPLKTVKNCCFHLFRSMSRALDRLPSLPLLLCFILSGCLDRFVDFLCRVSHRPHSIHEYVDAPMSVLFRIAPYTTQVLPNDLVYFMRVLLGSSGSDTFNTYVSVSGIHSHTQHRRQSREEEVNDETTNGNSTRK